MAGPGAVGAAAVEASGTGVGAGRETQPVAARFISNTMVMIYILSKMFSKYLKEHKKKKIEEKTEEKLKDIESFEKGLHEHEE